MEEERRKVSLLFSHVLLKIQKFNVCIHVYVCTYDCMCVYIQFITLPICNNGCDFAEVKHFSKQDDEENI